MQNEANACFVTGRMLTLLASVWDLFISSSCGLALVDIPIGRVIGCWARVCTWLNPATHLVAVGGAPGIHHMLKCWMLSLLTLQFQVMPNELKLPYCKMWPMHSLL